YTFSSFTNAQAWFRVAVYQGGTSAAHASSSWSVTQLAFPAPVATLTSTPPVKNLTADYVANYGDRAYLAWASQTLASGNTLVGHFIEKSTDGGATYSTVASNASTAVNYTVTGLTQGVSTIFRVTAITTNGNSLPGIVSFRPAVAPGVVRNLLATTTDRSVTLNWLAPVSTGGYPIIGYQIQQTSPTALVYITNTLSTTPSFTISGLTPGTQYNFSVFARTAFGLGAATVASVVPSGPSGPVVLLNASAVDRGQVTINWSEPSNYNGLLTSYAAGREMITGYRIETSIDPTVSASWTVNQTLTYPTTSYIVSGIPNGRTVWIRVTPTSTRGDGVSSMIPVLPSTAPDAPTQLVSVAGDGSVALSWIAPLGNGGLPIVGYQIEVSNPNSPTSFPSPFIANTGNTTTSFTVLGLNNSSSYGFRIKAISASGLLSNGATVTSSPIASGGAPSQVSVTPQTEGGVLAVTWAAPVALNGTVTRGYRIEVAPVGNDYPATPLSAMIPTGTLSYRIGGLTNGVNYKIRLTTIADTGPGESVESTGVPSTKATAPLRIFYSYDPISTNLNLSWTLPVNTGGLPISGWKLEYCLLASYLCDSSLATSYNVITNNTMSATPAYSFAASSYGSQSDSVRYRVSAITGASTLGIGETVDIPLYRNAMPARVTSTNALGGGNLTITTATPAGLIHKGDRIEIADLSAPGGWRAFSALTNPYCGDWYNGTGYSTLTCNTTQYFTVAGLTNGTVSVFRITPVYTTKDAQVTVEAAPTITSILPTAPPAGVTGLVATNPASGTINLTWTPPATAVVERVTGYRVEYSTSSTGGYTLATSVLGYSATQASISGLTNGTNYWFRITPLSPLGDGKFAIVQLIPFGTPTAPIFVRNGSNSDFTTNSGAIVLRWNAPIDTAGYTLLGYRIESCVANTETCTVVSPLTNVTVHTVSGITAATAVSYRVTPIFTPGSILGTPARFTVVSGVAQVPVANTPNYVENIAATYSTTGTLSDVTLTWTKPSAGTTPTAYTFFNGASGTTAVAGSTITALSGGTMVSGVFTPTSGATSFSAKITGVNIVSTQAHYFGIAGVAGAYTGLTSLVPLYLIPQTLGVGTITGTTQDSQIYVSWSAPSGAIAPVTYLVELRSALSGNAFTTVASNYAATNLYINGLVNGVSYDVRITPYSAQGIGTSSTGTGYVPATTPMQPVIVATPLSASSIRLTWVLPSDGGSPITSWQIYRGQNAGATLYQTISTNAATTFTFDDTSLPVSNSYYYAYQIVANNAKGTSAASTLIYGYPMGVFGPPTNVIATAQDSQNTLTWTAPVTIGQPVQGYRIERSFNGVEWLVLAASTGNANTSYVDPGLVNGTPVFYRVATLGSRGMSTYSPVIPIISTGPSPAPATLTGTGLDKQVFLQWQAPATSGGSPITGYRILSCTSPSISGFGATISNCSTVVTPNTNTTNTSYTVPSLLNGTTYYFALQAITAQGFGYVAATTAVPRQALPAPSSLTAAPTNGSVALSWTAPTAPAAFPVEGYRIDACSLVTCADADFVTLTGNTQSSSTSYTANGLTNGTIYTFRVYGVTSPFNLLTPGGIVLTTYGTYAQITSRPQSVPGVPRSFIATPGDGQVTLTWAAPLLTGGLDYSYYVTGNPFPGWAVAPGTSNGKLPSSQTSLVVPGLVNGTSYYFQIYAVNAVGNSSTVSSAPYPVVPGRLPSAPMTLAVVPGDGQATLSWSAPSDAGGYSIIRYLIEQQIGSTWTPLSQIITGTSVTIGGLTNGIQVNFRVSAVTQIGTGIASATTVIPAKIPASIVNFQASVGDGRATLNWLPPADSGGMPITGYQIEQLSPTSVVYATNAALPDSSGFPITGLNNGTSYQFRIAAVSTIGVGTYSTVFAVPGDVPPAPVNLSASSIGDKSFTFQWVAPPLPTGVVIGRYDLQYSSDGGATWMPSSSITVPSGTTSYVFQNSSSVSIANGSTYSVRIRAVNSIGNGQWSTLGAIVPGVVLGAPLNVAVVPGASDGSLVVSWSAPVDNGLTPLSYQVEYYQNASTTAPTSSYTIASTSALTSPYTIYGLTTVGKYWVRVLATNLKGAGAYGYPTVAATLAVGGTGLAPVTSLSTSAVTSSTATLTWVVPTGTITGIEVETTTVASPTSGDWTTVVTGLSSSATTYALTSLSSSTSYTLRVRAYATVAGVKYYGGDARVALATLPAAPIGAAPSGASSAYAAALTNPTPVIYWKVGETVTASTTAVNSGSGGTTFNGTYAGTNNAYLLLNQAGAGGRIAAKFSGSTTSGTASGITSNSATTGNINLTGNWSAEMWLNMPATSVTGYNYNVPILSKTVNNTDTTGEFILFANGDRENLQFQLQNAVTINGTVQLGYYPLATANGSLRRGMWNHIVIVVDSFTITAYINGVVSAIAPRPVNAVTNSVTAPLRVGVQAGVLNNGNYPYSWMFSDVALYTSALTATNVAAHWTAGGVAATEAVPVVSVDRATRKATLTWQAVSTGLAGSGIKPITAYRVEISNQNAGTSTWNTLLTVSGDTTTATVDVPVAIQASTIDGALSSSLQFGVALRVVAVNSAGVGAPSRSVSIQLMDPPLAVSGLSALAGPNTVGLSWTIPAQVGAPLAGFKVESSIDGRNWIQAGSNLAPTARSASITGLTNGTAYSFKVTSLYYSTSGVLTSGDASNVSATPYAPLAPPAGTSAISVVGSDPYSVAVSADTPLLWWRLGNLSSGASSVTNIGSAGSALNGVISTGVTLGSGGAQLASPTSAGQNAATIAGTAPSPGSITFNSANDSADYLSLRSFTVEQWFRLNALPASGNWINLLYRGTDLAGGSARNFSAWIYSTGYVQASIYNSAGTNFYVASAAGAIVPQTWYHMVFTFDGSVLKLYINGQPASATVMIDTPVLAGPNAGVFALDLSSSSNRFNGQVSDMAIYTNALSPDRVQSHWLSSVWGKKFTAPAQNGDDPYAAQIKNDAPTLWWRLNDSATATSAYDSSTNHFASTATGVAFAATPSPTQATALSAGFNGVESMISLPDTATVRGASASSGTTYSSHTVEFWFNAASLVNGKWYSLLGKGDFMTQSTSRTTGFMLYGDGTLHAIMSGMYTAYTAAGTIQPGRWYHAAYTWNGTSLLVYLNGQLVPTTLNAGANVSINVTDPFTVGNNPFTTAMLPFRGSIAEVAYYNVALSPDHLFEHYQASLYGELTPISAVATSNKVSLSWSAPSTSGGLSIVGYKIERSATVSTLGYSPNSVLSGTITVVTPNTGSAATTFDDTSVQNGNLYFYRVTPITNASTSIANPQPSGVIAAFPVNTPSAPASPTLSLWSNGGAALSWTAPVSNGGAVILGYVVQRRVEGGTYSADLGVTTQLRYRDTYPTPGVTYFYQVAAYNSAGRGAWAEVKFVPNIAPGIVYGPQITATVSGADPYATAVAADSPLLWWRLGDTSTVSTAKNFSSLLTTMDGTVGTGVTFGAASGANASPTTSGLGTATVAGTSTGAGAISLTSNAYTQLSAWTLETWVRLDALPSGLNWMRIVGKGNDGAGRNYELAVNANGQVRAVYDGYAGVTTALSVPGVMKAVSWYHLVFTFDGTNSRLYANGRFLASTALTIGNYNVPLISTSTTFSIDPVFATAGYTRFAGKIA
ncbi:MAG: hypothetical protein F2771_07915, partial [Actinobacteria bacterium]|nr:hypothetical protein [Actinomycetota bacterium]